MVYLMKGRFGNLSRCNLISFKRSFGFIGIYIVIVITKIYSLYRSLGFSRTVITPFLLVGVVFAFSGVTELLEGFIVEVGSVVLSLVMLVTAAFLMYGLSSYHKMLMKAEEGKISSSGSSRTQPFLFLCLLNIVYEDPHLQTLG